MAYVGAVAALLSIDVEVIRTLVREMFSPKAKTGRSEYAGSGAGL
ncbi:MAG: hypothetical protein Q9M45_04655 [Robiginitomaculum sp.]|nr:hypothetical protein [Robiginitomaculum sp.]